MERIERLFAAFRAARQHLDWPGRAVLPVNDGLPVIDLAATADGLEPLSEAATGHPGLARYADDLSQALCSYFGSSHASLWLLDGEAGRFRLRCLGAHASDGPNPQPPICEQQTYAGYFDALMREGMFRCADALTDARLSAMSPPPTWRAMLDICGQINGRTIGVMALGERDRARDWTKREELDLRRATAKVCLELHSLRHELEAA